MDQAPSIGDWLVPLLWVSGGVYVSLVVGVGAVKYLWAFHRPKRWRRE